MRDKRLRELTLFNLEERRLKGHLTAVFNCPMEEYEEVEECILFELHNGRVRCTRYTLAHGESQLDIWKKITHQEGGETLKQIPRESEESPPLEILAT